MQSVIMASLKMGHGLDCGGGTVLSRACGEREGPTEREREREGEKQSLTELLMQFFPSCVK